VNNPLTLHFKVAFWGCGSYNDMSNIGRIALKSSNRLFNMLYVVCFCLAATAILRQFSIYKSLCSRAYEDISVRYVALTFDDGPHPVYTERLLDELRKRGVKATFFVTGENALLYPEIISKMYDDGHLIGNHTYSHIQLTAYNRDSFRDELVRTNDIIYEITGQEVCYVRPPYGTWDKKLEAELNMFPVLWNIDTLDWCSSDASVIASRGLKNVGENDIILMHDYYSTSVEAAVIIVDELLRRGYEFVTVDRLLFD
jgi:peptidoglycan/xylan/chitin deacetylase (PgdA/CDA1 family)